MRKERPSIKQISFKHGSKKDENNKRIERLNKALNKLVSLRQYQVLDYQLLKLKYEKYEFMLEKEIQLMHAKTHNVFHVK